MLGLLRHFDRELSSFMRMPGWKSLDVDYEPPRVERLWLQVGECRLYLHRIHPCADALFHPHPWPSACKILTGSYEMGVGFGHSADGVDPIVASTMRLTAGAEYEMLHPDAWHYVKPIDEPSLSLMVTGTPWLPGELSAAHKLGKNQNLKRLTPMDEADLKLSFRTYVNDRDGIDRYST